MTNRVSGLGFGSYSQALPVIKLEYIGYEYKEKQHQTIEQDLSGSGG